MKCLKIVLALLLLVGLFGCTKDTKYDFYDNLEVVEETCIAIGVLEKNNISDDLMTDYYQSAYGWVNLTEHALYWDEQQSCVIAEFIFDDDVALWEIKSVRTYVLNTYVFKQLLSLGNPETYQNWSQEQVIKQVYAQVYVDGALICQDYYKCNDRIVEEEAHYENSSVVLADQIYVSENTEKVKEKMMLYLPKNTEEVVFLTDLKGQEIVVKIVSSEQVNPDNLESIQEELNGLNVENQEIVLELCSKNELYYRTRILKDAI